MCGYDNLLAELIKVKAQRDKLLEQAKAARRTFAHACEQSDLYLDECNKIDVAIKEVEES